VPDEMVDRGLQRPLPDNAADIGVLMQVAAPIC
jgi:hypothetical protein